MNDANGDLSNRINGLNTSEKAKVNWLEEGTIHYEAGRFSEALAAFERAIELAPHNLAAYQGKANALSKLRRYEETLKAYEQVLHLTSSFARDHYNTGNL